MCWPSLWEVRFILNPTIYFWIYLGFDSAYIFCEIYISGNIVIRFYVFIDHRVKFPIRQSSCDDCSKLRLRSSLYYSGPASLLRGHPCHWVWAKCEEQRRPDPTWQIHQRCLQWIFEHRYQQILHRAWRTHQCWLRLLLYFILNKSGNKWNCSCDLGPILVRIFGQDWLSHYSLLLPV